MSQGNARANLRSSIVTLYGAQLSLYVVPLIQVPYLARVLGPEVWGILAFAQGFAAYLMVITDYGLGLFGTRAIARARGDRVAERLVVTGVASAKLLLTGLCVGIAAGTSRFVPAFANDPLIFMLAVVVALSMAWSWGWFFLGIERPQLLTLADIAVRLLGLVALFIVVRQPEHAWRVLAISAVAMVMINTFGLALITHRCGVPIPSLKAGFATLRDGWYLFLFRGGVSLYTVGNAFVLGLLTTPAAVGYYVGAERILRAAVGLIDPVTAVLFPRFSRMVATGDSGVRGMLRTAILALGSLGALIGAGVLVMAPLMVAILLGPGFAPAATTLRVMAVLPLLIALSNALGIQWMIPNGLERPFAAIAYVAGAINVGLAFVLTPYFGENGMAAAWVGAELLVTLSCMMLVRRHLRRGGSPVVTTSDHSPTRLGVEDVHS